MSDKKITATGLNTTNNTLPGQYTRPVETQIHEADSELTENR